jgi:hypothetical protein
VLPVPLIIFLAKKLFNPLQLDLHSSSFFSPSISQQSNPFLLLIILTGLSASNVVQ